MHKSDYSSFLPPSVSSFSPVFLNSLLQCSTEISMETRFSLVSRDVQTYVKEMKVGWMQKTLVKAQSGLFSIVCGH